MITSIVIEMAREEDLPQVDLLRARVSNLERYLEHPSNYILKASSDGAIIGTIGVEYHGNYALLRDLFVVKDQRRKGIGSALIKRCFELCKKDGVKGIYLLTYFWNMRFFATLGFGLIRRRKGIPSEIGNCWQFQEKAYNRCVSLGREL